MKRVLTWGGLAGALCVSALGAQRVELRAAGVSRDTLYLMPGDTIPLQVVGKTAAGGTVVPTNIAFGQTAHCVQVLADARARARVIEAPCGLEPGWIRVAATVSGVIREDSAYIARPFTTALGSPFGLCLAWRPQSLYYVARDTTIALAIQGADRLIAANFLPDDAGPRWSWQGARLLVQYAAIACMPGYQVRDVTRLTATQWTSGNTGATVDRYGLATWRDPKQSLTISARWPK